MASVGVRGESSCTVDIARSTHHPHVLLFETQCVVAGRIPVCGANSDANPLSHVCACVCPTVSPHADHRNRAILQGFGAIEMQNDVSTAEMRYKFVC